MASKRFHSGTHALRLKALWPVRKVHCTWNRRPTLVSATLTRLRCVVFLGREARIRPCAHHRREGPCSETRLTTGDKVPADQTREVEDQGLDGCIALWKGQDDYIVASHTRIKCRTRFSFVQRENRRLSTTPAVSALTNVTHRGRVGCATADTRQVTASQVRSFARWST